MLARHLCRLAIGIIGMLGRRRRHAAVTRTISRCTIRLRVFVGAAWNVAPFGGIDWFAVTTLSLTHGTLLYGNLPGGQTACHSHTWQTGLRYDILLPNLARDA
jgi:hypothetical protein